MEEQQDSAVLARISGIVQGVGFRYYVMKKARNYGLTGYVKNLTDGSVETYAEGAKELLEKLLRDLKRGPLGSGVDDLNISWKNPRSRYTDFTIDF